MQKEKVEQGEERVQLKLDLGHGLWIAYVHIDELKEQDINARVMSKEMFDQLAKNMERRGYLESLPYCVKGEKKIEIISGHHRVRGCRAAGIMWIHILLDTNPLTRDEIIARQLAHNSIQGIDDKQMLRRLFETINDVDLRLETFIDPKTLSIILDTNIELLDINPEIQFRVVTLSFLPNQMEKFDDVVNQLRGDENAVYVVPLDIFQKFKEIVQSVQKNDNIKSTGMAVARMCEMVEEYLKEHAQHL